MILIISQLQQQESPTVTARYQQASVCLHARLRVRLHLPVCPLGVAGQCIANSVAVATGGWLLHAWTLGWPPMHDSSPAVPVSPRIPAPGVA